MLQQVISGMASCPFVVNISNESENGNHFHSELELIFLLRGRVTYLIGESRYDLKARDFIFANPYEIHSISLASDDCCYVHFLIQESRLRYLFASSDMLTFTWQESLNNRKGTVYQEIAAAVRTIVIEGANQEAGYLAKAYRELIRILIALNQCCRQTSVKDRGGKKSLNQQRKSCEIMDFINSHYMEQISLNTISKALYLSPPYISKIFKENFQTGVLEYINRLRVQKSIVPLCSSNAYIADIAEDCGFTNAKTYSRIFQKEMGVSPTDYRKQHSNEEKSAQPLFSSIKADIVQLFDLDSEGGFFPAGSEGDVSLPVKFDFTVPHDTQKRHPWNKILYAGTAELLLHHTARQTVLRAVKDFDVEYIRFMGALSDGLQIYQEDENGNPRYFWMLLDEVLYFITDHKVKPFIGLGYMPKKLAAADTPSPFHWGANTSGPKSYEKWENYLKAFLQHLVQLFSYEEVCTWRFEFWNDPSLNGTFWHDSQHAFREFFMVSYQAFRAVLPDGQFGSPGFVNLDEYQEAESFLAFCVKRHVRFDFLCMHLFELTDPRNPGLEKLNVFRTHQKSVHHGSRFVAESVNTFRAAADRAGCTAPIAITEWNVSPYFHDLSRDTSFMSAYILDTINRLPECVESISFWSLTDFTGEHSPHQDIFSGELGQRTVNDLAKPSYLTFKLLKRMQGNVLESGECYCITRSNRGCHITLYNYSFYNADFLNGKSRPLARKDRYQIFEAGQQKRFILDLTLEPGHYRIERHTLDREHGSIYDGWIRMGAPEFIDTTCYAYLNKIAYPDISIQYKNIHGNLIFSEQVPQHGVLLLSLIRLGDE